MCAHATLLVQRMNKLPRGFTLIELLVVIAIIGVLSSIVLTSLNSARVKARDTQRVTEVREIAKALTAYFIDHGYFPTYSNTVTSAESDFLSVLVTEKRKGRYPSVTARITSSCTNASSSSICASFLTNHL